jgi:hypothetical protein
MLVLEVRRICGRTAGIDVPDGRTAGIAVLDGRTAGIAVLDGRTAGIAVLDGRRRASGVTRYSPETAGVSLARKAGTFWGGGCLRADMGCSKGTALPPAD